jgi:hypothetical protein
LPERGLVLRYDTRMFLDESSIWPRKEDLPPRKPEFRHEKALSRILLFYALVLLLLPVSLGGFVDLFRYIFD